MRENREKMEKKRLQVSYDMMRICYVNYQQSVKAARAKYFVDIIYRYLQSLKVLFDIINTVLNPATTACHAPTGHLCNTRSASPRLLIILIESD